MSVVDQARVHEDVEAYVVLLARMQQPFHKLPAEMQAIVDRLARRAGARVGAPTREVGQSIASYMQRYPDLPQRLRAKIDASFTHLRIADRDRLAQGHQVLSRR